MKWFSFCFCFKNAEQLEEFITELSTISAGNGSSWRLFVLQRLLIVLGFHRIHGDFVLKSAWIYDAVDRWEKSKFVSKNLDFQMVRNLKKNFDIFELKKLKMCREMLDFCFLD